HAGTPHAVPASNEYKPIVAMCCGCYVAAANWRWVVTPVIPQGNRYAQHCPDHFCHRGGRRSRTCHMCIARQVCPMGAVVAARGTGRGWIDRADRDADPGLDGSAGAGRLCSAVDRGIGRLLSGFVSPAQEIAAQGRGGCPCRLGSGRIPDFAQPVAGVTVMRHPLHPALVHFPIAGWTLAVVADFSGLFLGEAAWSWSAGLLAMGCAMAVVAMLA